MGFGTTQCRRDFVHTCTVHREKDDGAAAAPGVRRIVDGQDTHRRISCANSSADTGCNSHASSDTQTLRAPERPPAPPAGVSRFWQAIRYM